MAGFFPNDPGAGGSGEWQRTQWNFAGEFGIRAPGAWVNLQAAGRPGASGVVVAVLDTGVDVGMTGRGVTPDFTVGRFVPGYDFVSRRRTVEDPSGHGSVVAGIVGEDTDNGIGLTGVAYGARIMPVRVLDESGNGRARDIASGIRFAARHGAQVINLSFAFPARTTGRDIPDVLDAIRYATGRGALVVAAAGNDTGRRLGLPARAPGVLSVGAITEHGCLASYSHRGPGLDLVAPGGGGDRATRGNPGCPRPGPLGHGIGALTYPLIGWSGTSLAAAHASGAAALVLASGAIGPAPGPQQVARRLRATARDLGPAGYDESFGAGLLDAWAATSLNSATPPRKGH
jgi:serine protease